ncbi:ArsR/SmtB family transcription factor [Streptoalloteichus hindustanus]|uniref:Transcriptional regulator, ArsR family n=1 Tax=Streptoalloteichus hindustanus TaxID=2017 RepID=A0A1M5MWG7_STRHI|nr:metalloregulator ArsR/SmtB family transcription factor [Streptoalloteichus hindustanus]SHG81113.1 transcriptional regulator, ArsR family [Streptoalloteichus hindustanus]
MDANDVDDRLFEVGRALSCRIRIALLHTLLDGDASVGELVASTGASQPNVSNHLATLRSAGLVAADREGRVIRYRLASPQAADLVRALSAAARAD